MAGAATRLIACGVSTPFAGNVALRPAMTDSAGGLLPAGLNPLRGERRAATPTSEGPGIWVDPGLNPLRGERRAATLIDACKKARDVKGLNPLRGERRAAT